ncbi:MAG: hypothetical protein Fur0042_19940 [Cyanophyceae cyanobacterium]
MAYHRGVLPTGFGMVCCLNPHCQRPLNPDGSRFCHHCGQPIIARLRDRYRPLHPIGQGGFGRNYLAIDDDRLQQYCVIKQLSPQVDRDRFQSPDSLRKYVQLFEEEARRLHELGEHPQIPTLFAYFAEGDRLYLVQQFIEGQTLTQALAKGGLFDEAQARSLLLALLPVLRFVHDRQVIHRDIKPDNILLPKDGGKPFLIDFGVAKQLTGQSETRGGTKVGTEGYAPLEQLRSGQAYPASDLYSLGATCLYAITGQSPDDLYDPLSGGWPWAKILGPQGAAMGPQLATVLKRMLQDRVGDRYQSAQEVLQDLGDRRGVRRTEAMPSPDRLLERLVWPCAHTLAGHGDRVLSVVFAPDGTSLFSASGDRTIKRWDWVAGQERQTLIGHGSRVNALAIDPNGRILASGSSDRTVRLWNLADGTPRSELKNHIDWVSALAIHPDGEILVSGGDDGRLNFWTLGTGDLVQGMELPQKRQICSLAFSACGRWLACGSADATIRLWSVAERALALTLTQHVGRVNALEFSADGRWLISGGEDKTVKLWPLRTTDGLPEERPARTLGDHGDSVFAVATSASALLLATGSEDHTVKLWNLETGKPLGTLTGHGWWVNAVAIAPDGTTVASGSGDRAVKVWKAQV